MCWDETSSVDFQGTLDFPTMALRGAMVVFIFVEFGRPASVEVTFALTKELPPLQNSLSDL